ncbi:MAG: PDDEXK nuclease domain-containing protein [Saprospiraceae bacterium]
MKEISAVQKIYDGLLQQIKQTYLDGQGSALQMARRQMVLTYWAIGRHIVEFEQGGAEHAVYGSQLLERLSKDLSHQLGRGFNRSNLIYMRLVFIKYPDANNLSHELTWAHYVELIKIDHDLERSFYEKQTALERWTVRELKRQKDAALFLRLAASGDKAGVLKLANQGKIIEQPEDLLRDPYIFEFLKIPEPYHLSEKELETRLLDNLQSFLLELGKGFAFVGRQYRIIIDVTPTLNHSCS